MDPMSATVLGGLGVVVAVSAALCGKHAKAYRFWRKIGVPFVKPFPVLGSLYRNHLGPDIAKLEMELHKTKGPVYGIFLNGMPMLSVSDPKVLQTVLGKSPIFPNRRPMHNNDDVLDSVLINCTGERRKRIADVIQPAFGGVYLETASKTMTSATQNLISKLEKIEPEGSPVDMKKEFEEFVVEVILRAVFSSKANSQDEMKKFVASAQAIFQGKFTPKELVQALPSALLVKPVASWLIAGSPIKFFKDFAVKVVQERIESGTKFIDYLQLLIDANSRLQDSEINAASKDSKKYVSYSEMLGQSVMFFLGGFGTTVGTLSFTAYELAANPEIQERLIQEIDQTFKEKEELDYRTARRMQFLNCVISETLRKYPVIRTDRVAACDYTMHDYNITIPKGTIVSAPVYAMHHDPKIYPDPERFRPDRFALDPSAVYFPTTYLSFGYGFRMCFGKQFARTEMLICLSHLLRKVRFRLCPETQVPLTFTYGQDVLSPKEVKLRIEFRKDNVNSKQA